MTEPIFGPNGNNYGRDPKHPEVLGLKAFDPAQITEPSDHFIANVNKMAEALNDTPLMSRKREAKDRSWIEDQQHENGNYECWCSSCNRVFFGHKRRVTCKLCVHPAERLSMATVAVSIKLLLSLLEQSRGYVADGAHDQSGTALLERIDATLKLHKTIKELQ